MKVINSHILDEEVKNLYKNPNKFRYEKEIAELLKEISTEFYMYLNTTSEYFGISNEEYHRFFDKDGAKNKLIQKKFLEIINKLSKQQSAKEGVVK